MKVIVKILHPSQCLYVDRHARLPCKVVNLGKDGMQCPVCRQSESNWL
jgi:hypothetical protein